MSVQACVCYALVLLRLSITFPLSFPSLSSLALNGLLSTFVFSLLFLDDPRRVLPFKYLFNNTNNKISCIFAQFCSTEQKDPEPSLHIYGYTSLHSSTILYIYIDRHRVGGVSIYVTSRGIRVPGLALAEYQYKEIKGRGRRSEKFLFFFPIFYTLPDPLFSF